MMIFLGLMIGLIYILVYSFASFLFSYKIYLVSNDKYNLGALVSGVGLFINFSLYAFVPYIAIATTIWWLALILLFALAIGAFLSTAIMSKVDFFHTKNNDVKEGD